MREELSRGLRAVAAVVVMLSPAASAAGQPASFSLALQAGQAPAQPAGSSVRRLSVDETVRLALEQNANIQVERLNPQIQDLSIAQVRTAWTPTFSSSVTGGSTDSPVSSIFAGAQDKLTQNAFSTTFGASQLLPWGASYTVAWDSARISSNNAFSTRNPSLGSTLSGSYVQPLVRNLKIDSSRQQLLVTKKNRETSDVQLQQTVLGTVRSVKNVYWNLSYAISSLAVQNQSLDLARESLKNNKTRVTIGTMAPIDIVEAEAEVAQREEAVIVAEAAVAQAEDALRSLIFDPADPGIWTIKLELTDQPAFQAQAIDIDTAVTTALDKRTDIQQVKKSLETSDINIRYYQNQTLPAVNVQADYGVQGQGGTQLDLQGFPNPVEVGRSEKGYGSVLSDLFGRKFPNWSLALTVSYPLGTSSAQASLARARLLRTQAQAQIRALELQVATQVRDLGRQVNTNLKRVGATRASRQLSEKRLEAEQKKFAAGMSTSFLVFQAQRDLAQARNAEISAILDYNRSLVDFDTVQQAPLSGGSISLGSTATTDTSATSGTGTSSSTGTGAVM